MDRSRSSAGDRGLSPVLGEALLIAIGIFLVAFLGFLVVGYGLGDPPEPVASVDFSQTPPNGTTYNITLFHLHGDPLPASEITVKVVDQSGDGNDHAQFSETLTAGESLQIASAVEPGDTVYVVWRDPSDTTTTVIAKYTVH